MVESGNVWKNAVLEIVPDKDFYAIAIGPECAPISSTVSLYYFFDNLLLADLESFNLQVLKRSITPVVRTYRLAMPNNSAFDYQWYKAGVALVGRNRFRIDAELWSGYGYQVRILDGSFLPRFRIF